MWTTKVPLLLVLIWAISSNSCVSTTSPDDKDFPGSGPIKIGALFAQTGRASFIGEPEAKVARMMADQINATGGIDGRQIQLILRDTMGSIERTKNFAEELINQVLLRLPVESTKDFCQ